MRKLICFSFLLVPFFPINAQNKYGLKPTRFQEYKESLISHPEKELVDLEKIIPGIVMDIRYATANNFTGQKMYNSARAFARKPVAEALRKAQAEFNTLGLSVKMYDGYRPYRITVKFYEIYHDTTYVASPYRGSRHNRGCALDMTVVDSKTREEIKMPTGYDSFEKAAWPTSEVADKQIRENRALLIRVMEKQGFKVNASEWWHFDFIGWQAYEVLDIDFEELDGH
jgi:zinc D-Ala-D-Ala dipeptidase